MSNKTSGGGVFSFFFLRRVPAVIWGLVLVGFGLVAYNAMSKEALPDLEIPTFYVTTEWEGANAAMVEKSVTQKIEKELRGIRGVKRVRSASSYSTSVVVVVFEAECGVPESQQLVSQRLAAARGTLPRDAKEPRVEISSVNDLPIATVALSGEVGLEVLEELGRSLRRTLEQVPGIRRVNPVGIRKQIVHVQLRAERLKEFGIPATVVRSRIVNNGLDAPWGRFENREVDFILRMDGVYDELSDLENLYIGKGFGGGVVRLGDVAEVRYSHMYGEQRAALSWEGGGYESVVGLSLLKAPGRDTIEMVNQVSRTLTRLREQSSWPVGVTWRLTGNEGDMIETELERGLTNGWQAMLAVFLVLLMLLTWREAIVAALSVPLTLCGTVAVLWAMGYTFNLLVIVGMIIALGLLVDDFILIMEGMHEGIFIKRLGYAKAVRRTIGTYAVPSFSGSITTILVFAPLAFIGGVDGKFIRVIPVTAAVCLVVSYVVSIVIGPVLLRPFLGRNKDHGPCFVDKVSHMVEGRLESWLGRHVVASKRKAMLWLAGAAVLFMLSLVASEGMRTTLYPDEDGRTIGVSVELAYGTPLDETARVAERVGEILRGKPYIEHVMRVVGDKDAYSRSSMYDHMTRTVTTHVMGFGCYLVPGKERDELAVDFVEELKSEVRAELADVPGAQVFVNAARGGPTGEDPIQIEVTGTDLDRLRAISQEIKVRLAEVPGIYDIRDNIGPARIERSYKPMQEALDHHGLTQADLAAQMMAYMENERLADFQREGTRDHLDIRLGTWWKSREGSMGGPRDWDELARLSIVTPSGDIVPLESLAVPGMTTATPTILHSDGLRSVTVLAKNQGIYEPEVLDRMRPVMDAMRDQWPVGYDYTFVGEEEADTTYSNMGSAFIGAVVLVFGVLALLFDSLLLPLIILSTVLFALVGVFFGFMLLGFPFSFSAAIGIVALVGIVVNDAIIVVETMRNHTKAGKSLMESARLGAADRLRPIVSTTITNFAGLMPLALSDPGWAPICQAIILGEITATAGAVVLIPALYLLLAKKPRSLAESPARASTSEATA